MTDEELLSALLAQTTMMCKHGIGSFQGMPARQQRVELVGGGGDGTLIRIGYQAPLRDRFVARGEYDDGSGQEKAEYVRELHLPHPVAQPVTRYRFAGVPPA